MPPTLPRTFLPSLPQTNAWAPVPGTSFPSRRDQQVALGAAGQEAVDTYDLLSQLGSAITAVLHEIYGYPLQSAVYAAQAYVDYKKGADAQHADLATKGNPLLAAHGLETGAGSPVTARYLMTRRWKKIGGGVVQTIGNLMSLSPANLHQNVAGAAYHGHATALTAQHIVAIETLARAHAINHELLDWIAVVRVAKLTKLAIRGGQLAGAVIPAASLPTSIIAAAAKAGVKMTYAGACLAAAAKLHFAAYLERHPPTAITADCAVRSAGPVPNDNRPLQRAASAPIPNFSRPLQRAASAPVPNFSRPLHASAASSATAILPAPALAPYLPVRTDGAIPIVREIFTRRFGRQLLGAYEVNALIDEPAGWLALADKLMLM